MSGCDRRGAPTGDVPPHSSRGKPHSGNTPEGDGQPHSSSGNPHSGNMPEGDGQPHSSSSKPHSGNMPEGDGQPHSSSSKPHSGNMPEGRQTARGAVAIVDAADAHIDVIASLERLCFSEPWKETHFLMILDDPHVYFRVATVDGQVAGYLVLIFAADTAQLANLAVDPARRRHGIGAALLDDALEFCKRRGIVNLSLEVRESNAPARALYASRGFSDVGRRRGYYSQPREDAVVMVLNPGDG